MYGLSPAEDLSFFYKLRVTRVSETAYQTIVYFGSSVDLSINDSEYAFNDERHHTGDGSHLRGLLGTIVETADRTPQGELKIIFSSGDELRVPDANAPQYESYTITTPDGGIIVV